MDDARCGQEWKRVCCLVQLRYLLHIWSSKLQSKQLTPRRNELRPAQQYSQLHGQRHNSSGRHGCHRLGHRTVQNRVRTHQHRDRPEPQVQQPLLHNQRMHSWPLLRGLGPDRSSGRRQSWKLRPISNNLQRISKQWHVLVSAHYPLKPCRQRSALRHSRLPDRHSLRRILHNPVRPVQSQDRCSRVHIK